MKTHRHFDLGGIHTLPSPKMIEYSAFSEVDFSERAIATCFDTPSVGSGSSAKGERISSERCDVVRNATGSGFYPTMATDRKGW